MADDSDYFTRRAIEEGKFAAAASSIAARARHEELALLYWSLANGAAAARGTSILTAPQWHEPVTGMA